LILTSKLGLWAPVAACMAAIFYLSAQADLSLPTGVDDKSAHYIAYATLGVLVVRALGRGLPARIGPRVALLALLVTSGYGATDEWHQTFVPGRTAALGDWYADTVGAITAVALCWAWGMIAIRPDA
jgi:VanZ family protein